MNLNSVNGLGWLIADGKHHQTITAREGLHAGNRCSSFIKGITSLGRRVIIISGDPSSIAGKAPASAAWIKNITIAIGSSTGTIFKVTAALPWRIERSELCRKTTVLAESIASASTFYFPIIKFGMETTALPPEIDALTERASLNPVARGVIATLTVWAVGNNKREPAPLWTLPGTLAVWL